MTHGRMRNSVWGSLASEQRVMTPPLPHTASNQILKTTTELANFFGEKMDTQFFVAGVLIPQVAATQNAVRTAIKDDSGNRYKNKKDADSSYTRNTQSFEDILDSCKE